MDDRETKMKCLKLANLPTVSGNLPPTEDVIARAKSYFEFISASCDPSQGTDTQ